MLLTVKRPLGTWTTACVLIAAVFGGTVPQNPASADPDKDGFIWFEIEDPKANTYYRSQLTGSYLPLRHTDPRFTGAPGQKVVTAASLGRTKQQQTVDEINHLAQLLSDRNGRVQGIIDDRKSMLYRTGSEFSAVATQVGSVSKEMRDAYYDSLRQIAECQARLEAIGYVYEAIKKTLTRDGMEWFSNMAQTEQAVIDATVEHIARMDSTIHKAAWIDFASLGLGRLGSALGKTIAARKLAQETATTAVATEGAQQSANAVVKASEKKLATEVLESTVEETGEKLATATEKKATTEALADLSEKVTTRFETEAGRAAANEANKKVASAQAAEAITAAEARLATARAESTLAQRQAASGQRAADAATRVETQLADEAQNAARNLAEAKQALTDLPKEVARQLETATAEQAAKTSGLRETWKRLVAARNAARETLRNATQTGRAEARKAFDAAEAARKEAYDAYVAAREVRDALQDSTQQVLAARTRDLQNQIARLETEAAKASAARQTASETANEARNAAVAAHEAADQGKRAVTTASQELFESNINGAYRSAEYTKAVDDLLKAQEGLKQAERLSTGLRATATEVAATQKALLEQMKTAAEKLLAILGETSSQTAHTLSQSMADLARANSELTAVQIARLSERTTRLATEGVERATEKFITAREMFLTSQQKYLDAMAAKTAAELKLLKETDPSRRVRVLRELIGDFGAILANLFTGNRAAARMEQVIEELTPEEKKILDETLKAAPPELKKQFEELMTGDVAPVDSSQDGTAPVTSDQNPENRTKVADADIAPVTSEGSSTGDADIAPITSAKAPKPPKPATTSEVGGDGTATGEAVAPPPVAEEPPTKEGATGDAVAPPPTAEEQPANDGTTGDGPSSDDGSYRLPPMLFPDEDPERFRVGGDLGFAFAGMIPSIRVDLDETVMLASATYTAAIVPPDESLTAHLSDEEREKRLIAIRSFRERPTGRTGTDVSLPFSQSPLREMRYRVREDIKDRLSELERQDDSGNRRNRPSDLMETEPLTETSTGTPTEPPPVDPPPSDPPITTKPTPTLFESRVGSNWRPVTVDPESGVSNVVIYKEGNQYLLRGMGPNIPLRVEGNHAYGTGGVLFGTGNHDIVMSIQGENIHLEATHPNGGTWSTMLVRAN
jgi:hypothetical protein